MLEDWKKYTGHTYRRSGASILAEAGVEDLTLKRAGRWKSSAVAESYIGESDTEKKRIFHKMNGSAPQVSSDVDAAKVKRLNTGDVLFSSMKGLMENNNFNNCGFNFSFTIQN